MADAAGVLGFEPRLEDRTDPGEASGWDPSLLHDLLAALRESLANVARHARASRADVVLEVSDGAVRLIVEDDGLGLPEHTDRTSGLGNLSARAQQHGGSCALTARPGGGTRVEWTARLG